MEPAHRPPEPSRAVLGRAFLLTLAFAAVEGLAGWWTGSLTLLGDAGHMVADSAGLALALVAAHVAERRPSRRFSYGLGRVEVVAAVANGVLLVGLVAWLVAEAIGRLGSPPPVRSGPALAVAVLGGAMNLLVARMLLAGDRTLNVRAAFLHVLGDLLGSAAAIVANVLVLATGWLAADPLLTLLIAVLLLLSAVRVVRAGLRILLEGVPEHLDLETVGRAIAGVPGVASVHDLHVWQVSSRDTALSAHVVLEDPAQWEAVLPRVREVLALEFRVDHATLQPERAPGPIPLGRAGPARGGDEARRR